MVHFRLPGRNSWSDRNQNARRSARADLRTVQNFSQIRSVVSEEMHPEQKDRQANHAEDNNDTFIAYTGCFKKVAP